MTGSANQVEWAVLIKGTVANEFDRVAKAFVDLASKQSVEDRADTVAIISILNEKRAEVMAIDQAGYFISAWQDLSGKVRSAIAADPRYQAIKAGREARRRLIKAMNIRPLYDRIVVRRIDEKETTRNGIVIPDSAQEKPHEGEVLATGRGKRLDGGEMVNLDVKAGDRILFGKYSGNEITLEGAEYIIMREDDVLGVLDPGAAASKKSLSPAS